MSRNCCCTQRPMCMPMPHCGYQGGGLGTGCCNFSALIILILILLFFGKGFDKRRGPCGEERGHGDGFGFNGLFGGIIFIITLFYLSCCGPGKCATPSPCGMGYGMGY